MIKALSVLIFAVVQFGYSDAATTAFPEICRVMALYRSCSDVTFRAACPNSCSPPSGKCGSLKYYPSTGYCYQATDTHVSVWTYALEFCRAYSANLAPLPTAADADLIAELVTLSGSTRNEFHIGCLNAATDQLWVYTDNVIGEGSNTNWDSGYPQVSADKSNCMWVRRGSSYSQRNDDCNQNYGYICYINPYTNTTI